MRRKLSSGKAAGPGRTPRRGPGGDIPAVPTFEADPAAVAPPPPETTEDAAAEEAVRRMVEAAYT